MKKILIANRGEIAIRVMSTAKKMGIKTVAVYSDIDREAAHVQYADEAFYLGEAAASASYLNIDKVIEAAKLSGADGIHPGYGFLSENADFAERVLNEGIIFIGPKPDAIRLMGSKLAAKEAVKDHHIPMVPGIEEAINDIAEANDIAQKIGFPILIKASAGGGGKGMRVVESVDQLSEQMERAISEATSAFGDGSVFIEKYVTSPRHIEIQVLADAHGNVVHLFERECSIQRRHQKVVEEAPSSVLTQEKRMEMGEAAIRVAKSCNYLGAGTVEFLLDGDHNFYFLEMNTRLQVEHPVTEWITGVDLVKEQINIAKGLPLSFKQKDLKIKGHALELRVYAEDPLDNFMPSIGRLEWYEIPSGNHVRVDHGYYQGAEIPIQYDPMIAKLITYGNDRIEAIEEMKKAIKDYKVEGLSTTLPFGAFVCEHYAFITGDFDTHFVKNYYSANQMIDKEKEENEVAAKLGLMFLLEEQKKLRVVQNKPTNWK